MEVITVGFGIQVFPPDSKTGTDDYFELISFEIQKDTPPHLRQQILKFDPLFGPNKLNALQSQNLTRRLVSNEPNYYWKQTKETTVPKIFDDTKIFNILCSSKYLPHEKNGMYELVVPECQCLTFLGCVSNEGPLDLFLTAKSRKKRGGITFGLTAGLPKTPDLILNRREFFAKFDSNADEEQFFSKLRCGNGRLSFTSYENDGEAHTKCLEPKVVSNLNCSIHEFMVVKQIMFCFEILLDEEKLVATEIEGNTNLINEYLPGLTKTPLILACQKGSKKVFDLLVNMTGIELDKERSGHDSTAMAYACVYNTEFAFTLAEKGASVEGMARYCENPNILSKLTKIKKFGNTARDSIVNT